MNLQRLKHAWVRGARIQVRQGTTGDEWLTVDYMQFDYYWIRLHPEDEHLQYGALSNALRDSVLFLDTGAPFEFIAAINWFRDEGYVAEAFPMGGFDYHMSVLFFAEYLADQGL